MRRICIVGCGRIAKAHAGKIRSHVLSRQIELFFYSRQIGSAQKLCRKVGGQGVYATYEEVLQDPNVSAVVICSPPEFHLEQILQAARAEKAIVVEKPLCTSPEELSTIEKALQGYKRPFMVAENYYYKPSLHTINEWIESGHLGEVKRVFLKKNFKQKSEGWKSQYGALLEGGIHFVAFLSDVVDHAASASVLRPSQVEAKFPGLCAGSSVEHSSILNISYPAGVSGELMYSWETDALPGGVFQHSFIEGTKGKITFESNGLYVRLRGKTNGAKKTVFPKLSDVAGSHEMWDDFLAAIFSEGSGQAESPVLSNFARAQRDLEIVFKAYAQNPKLSPSGKIRPFSKICG